MERPDTKSQPQRAAAESGQPRREPAQAPPHPLVAEKPPEHTEMRFEPQLEEPGYGHGV
jgi:hypothetical protein